MITKEFNTRTAVYSPERVYVDREVERHARTAEILGRLAGVPVEIVDDVRRLKRPANLTAAKRDLILTMHRGRSFKPCQGMPQDDTEWPHICCCYHVIDLVSGCPMDCSYCILQHYLENNPRTTVYVNLEDVVDEVRTFLHERSHQTFRIGTGELSDSLALDPLTRFADELIPFFARQENAILELKTKTAFVDHLLNLDHGGRTVIAWSLNAPRIVHDEERGAASLEQRFAAARRCVDAGYRVAFHFDPVIMATGSDEEVRDYVGVVDRIFEAVKPPHIAWVSLGLLRLPFSMKALVQRRFPRTRIFGGELVPAGGKMRYAKFLRTDYYKPLWDALAKHLPPEKMYLCMETAEVWRNLDAAIICHDELANRLGCSGI